MTEPWDFEEEDSDLHIDMTPLIDVVFMLIIFLVLTASFMKPALEVNLPEVSGDYGPGNTSAILVAVTAGGELLADGAACTPAELTNLLRQYPDRGLDIQADRDAPFRHVAEVMRIAGRERGGRFTIAVAGNPPEAGSGSGSLK